MKDRFRPQMIQSGLFAPNTFGRCDFFYSYGLFYSNACCQNSHLFRLLTFLWVGASWTPPYGIKTESIPEPKARSRNQSFLVKRNRNRNRFHVAMLYWNRNRNHLQFFQSGIGIDSGQLESSTSLDVSRKRIGHPDPIKPGNTG